MTTTVLPSGDFQTAVDDVLEIFCLIWLDANTNAQEVRHTEQKLRSIINRLKKFQDVAQCQKYIEERSQNERVVMIVSGQLGRTIVPTIYKLRQVISIYVYCMDKEGNEKWACKFGKVKAVMVDLNELISRIKADHKIQKIVEEPFSINIFTTSAGAGTSTMGINGQFVFFQVLIDCLLRLKCTQTDTEELINRCKQQYEGNSVELNNLNKFQKDYSPDKVLWWYTQESFFYKTLNAALRNQNIHMIFLFRAFIADIYLQLKNYQAKHPLRVYRGQMISSDELLTLKKYCGQFISVNSFFSTSISYQQAHSFLNVSYATDNLEPILFEIDAHPKMVTTKPFADISAHSDFSGESEILFMLGSIFRLDSIDRSKDGSVWIIRMTLCSDDEHDLKQVLVDMKQQLGTGEVDLQTLGKLLWDMGKFDLAEKYFNRLLEQLSPSSHLLGNLYEDLAKLASHVGDYDKSVQWRKKALEFKNQHQSTSISSIDKAKKSIGTYIPGSSLRSAVRADLDTRSIRCYGPGLDSNGILQSRFPIVYSDPAPEIWWTFQNKIIGKMISAVNEPDIHTGSYTIRYLCLSTSSMDLSPATCLNKTTTLTISNIGTEHNGTYNCVAAIRNQGRSDNEYLSYELRVRQTSLINSSFLLWIIGIFLFLFLFLLILLCLCCILRCYQSNRQQTKRNKALLFDSMNNQNGFLVENGNMYKEKNDEQHRYVTNGTYDPYDMVDSRSQLGPPMYSEVRIIDSTPLRSIGGGSMSSTLLRRNDPFYDSSRSDKQLYEQVYRPSPLESTIVDEFEDEMIFPTGYEEDYQYREDIIKPNQAVDPRRQAKVQHTNHDRTNETNVLPLSNPINENHISDEKFTSTSNITNKSNLDFNSKFNKSESPYAGLVESQL
ncbi:unnamed protein product [Rotaria sp. Silwood2]|nr:unnamed protein product [Rotaria sp. Silwood2]